MAENGFSDQVGVSHYHPALWRSASSMMVWEVIFLLGFFFLFLISDWSWESDTGKCGIIIEYAEPYKCDILLAAVMAAAGPGWEGEMRMMGRQAMPAVWEEESFARINLVLFGQQSTQTALLYCKWITQYLLGDGIDGYKEHRSKSHIVSNNG